MQPQIKKALSIILVSLGLAFIFNFLFFDKIIGVSLVIFTVILLGSVYVSAYFYPQELSFKKTWWLGMFIVFFSVMPAIRANPFLIFLDVCATFGLFMVLAYQLHGTPVFLMKLRDYAVLAVVVPFRMLRSAFATVSIVNQIHSNSTHRDVWLRAFKGVIMAVPLLILFALLFSGADLAFAKFVQNFIHISISERTVQHLVLLFISFSAGLSFLSYIFFAKKSETSVFPDQSPRAVKSAKGIEVMVILGLIGLLFAVFIGFQITYLFGGETNIVNAGFTYAEYARRGFWELLAVAFLSLLVLLASEKYAHVESKMNKQFLVPSLILIAEVVVVIISALKRLALYIDAYGMTMLRFYVGSFIVLLFVLFVLLVIKFIKSKPETFFTFGTLLSIIAFLVIINVLNPDVFIIKSNMQQFERTGKIDVAYIDDLSADAEQEKIELYNKLEGEDKETIKKLLLADKDYLQQWKASWQSANLSRTKALHVLREVE